MAEFWLVVTLCLAPAVGTAPYGAHHSVLTTDCAEYRAEPSFSSIESCRLHQTFLHTLPVEHRTVAATLCTRGLDRQRLEDLPLLSAALGDRA